MCSVPSRVFRYGVATVRCDKDVASDLRGTIATPKTKHFAAITDPSEVGKLLNAIDGYTGQSVTRMAIRLTPHVLLRPGELRQAEWGDIDIGAAIWSIPPDRMKMRRPHRVPLSRQVLLMLEELRILTDHRQYLFPCMGKPRKAMSENAVNQGLRRLGYTSNQVTAHGFRAMAVTPTQRVGHPVRVIRDQMRKPLDVTYRLDQLGDRPDLIIFYPIQFIDQDHYGQLSQPASAMSVSYRSNRMAGEVNRSPISI